MAWQHPTTAAPAATLPTTIAFMRMRHVMQRTGLGRSTIYRLIAANQFPAQVRLAGRAVGWRVSDLEQWSLTRQSATH